MQVLGYILKRYELKLNSFFKFSWPSTARSPEQTGRKNMQVGRRRRRRTGFSRVKYTENLLNSCQEGKPKFHMSLAGLLFRRNITALNYSHQERMYHYWLVWQHFRLQSLYCVKGQEGFEWWFWNNMERNCRILHFHFGFMYSQKPQRSFQGNGTLSRKSNF